MTTPSAPRAAYASAGVDVDAADALVEAIKPAAAATRRPGADPALGGFGALFDLRAAGHEGSLLVASTDGVGTKVRLAAQTGLHRGIGIDLVAMCVNDIVAQGAEPLFFLDYFATSALSGVAAREVIEGIAAGCRMAGCALIGGETAEMPGHYAPGDYDLAGFVVGAVKRESVLPSPEIAAGDALIGLPASGAHANGFSLIRKLVADGALDLDAPLAGTNQSLAEALMEPTRIYAQPVLAALAAHPGAVRGIAHITGGGLTGNVPRMLRAGLDAALTRATLPRHPVMATLKAAGGLDDEAMEATFNCGVGLVMAVDAAAVADIMETLRREGEAPTVIGAVVAGEGEPSAIIA